MENGCECTIAQPNAEGPRGGILTEELRIRRATFDDWPRIWPVVAEAFAAGDAYALPADISEQQARDLWMGAGTTAYVAEIGDEVVGTYALKSNFPGQGSHVANAGYVVRGARCGRGIGRALGEHSLKEARSAGYTAMQFNCVVSTNVRAVQLWQRLGFSIIGTVPGGFRHPVQGLVDFHIMHRFL